MHPLFRPRLINSPFDDPGVFVPLTFENRALLFDLGDLSALSARDIRKISHVFVTHTHMDHFIGFDRLLRLQLGRNVRLSLFGPRGFLENIAGKLAGYTWNLLDSSTDHLQIAASEIDGTDLRTQHYRGRQRFRPSAAPDTRPFSGKLHSEAGFYVETAVLDHGIPCLGFSLCERFHVNIVREALDALGLAVGPWLGDLKQMLYRQQDPETVVTAPDRNGKQNRFGLGELARQIVRITPGMKISYVADVGYHDENREKIIALVHNADHLFIEAAFMDEHASIAKGKHHLTAGQAGLLARAAGVKRISVFHFSPRYQEQAERMQRQAEIAFGQGSRNRGPF